MRMQLPPANYPTRGRAPAFLRAAAAKGRCDSRASRARRSRPPCRRSITRNGASSRSAAATQVEDERRPFVSARSRVSPRYFETLGVGHEPRPRHRDQPTAQPGSANVVINQMMADAFFPGEDPIGRRIRFVPRRDEPDAPPQPWRTIVGVSADRSCRAATTRRSAAPWSICRSCQSAPRSDVIADRPQRAAAGQRHGGGPRRRADDRRRSAGLRHRNHRAASSPTNASIYRIFATLFAVLAVDRPGAVGGRRLRRDRLRGDAAHAGDRRAHGNWREALGCVVDVPAEGPGAARA